MAQVTELSGLTSTASSDYQAALVARQASKDATGTYHGSTGNLRTLGAALVATIKAYAEATGDPGVYSAASIPAPADPTPSADPVAPTDIALSMRPQGYIDITWTGTVAGGTFYEVQRSLSGGAEWTTIASVPARTTLDQGVPAGTEQAFYRIRAVKPPAGAGSQNRDPRYSTWTAPQVVFLGNPGNQQLSLTEAA